MLSYNDVFNELQDYILDEDRINKSIKLKPATSQTRASETAPRPSQSQHCLFLRSRIACFGASIF